MMSKIFLSMSLCAASLGLAHAAHATSELDYLSDLPIVLSVSRLPQRLDETPGAVTVLDRAMIRLSGARDVAELMRLVPGFQTSSSFERIAPQASYHGAFTSYSNHLQVLVDGRSVYSPYFVGSTEAGLQTVALEDIERIEVLRGSNSAAYGARAMLGVINIVTRHTADTLGVALGLASGENGIRDARASFGWGQPESSFRLGVDRRGDDGLLGANGKNAINRFNFRGDIRPNPLDEIQLRLGGTQISAGKGGDPDRPDDLLRDQAYDSSYVQLDWRRILGPDEDLALSFSKGQETYDERLPPVIFGVCCWDVDVSGRSFSDAVSVVHTFRKNSDVRVVWGGEWRREQVNSLGLYSTNELFTTNFSRFFGNIEWRMRPNLILNAGALAEKATLIEDAVAPRLMLNWQFNEGQTLRAGASKAFRPPSTFEKFGNYQYFLNGVSQGNPIRSSGRALSEQVVSRELGYLSSFPHVKLSLDARLFYEQISDLIVLSRRDYKNSPSFDVTGLEYQLKWQPWSGGQLVLNQAFVSNNATDEDHAAAAPKRAYSLAFFQKLNSGLNLTLMHQNSSLAALPGYNSTGQTTSARTDVRLSAPLNLGASKGEVALVVQNLGAPYADFSPRFQFERRAFITLRVEH
jgi:iron complex outermembrane receptor protein